MKHAAVKNYRFAGLDFIFNAEGEPYFLEANSVPHGLEEYIEKINKKILKKIADLLLKRGPSVCYVVSKKKTEQYDNAVWLYRLLSKEIGSLHLCYCEGNAQRKKYLYTEKKERIIPNTVFSYDPKVLHLLKKNFGEKFVNHPSVHEIVKDKYQLYQRLHQKIRMPKSFLVASKKEVEETLSRENMRNFVLKPIQGSLGKGVVIRSSRKIPALTYPLLLQEEIIPPNNHAQYWDVRVFVIDGRYVGCIGRFSNKKVTNFAQGAVPKKIARSLEKKLIRPALEVVNLINEYACEITKDLYTTK